MPAYKYKPISHCKHLTCFLANYLFPVSGLNCELNCFMFHASRNEKHRYKFRIHESVGSLHRFLVTSKGAEHLIFHKDELQAIL